MNRLEVKLQTLSPGLFGKLNETREEVKLLLTQYVKNFPEYTDHSIEHTTEVFNIVDEILTDEELNNLNADELYVLSMASYLHDIGMCIPEDKICLIADTEELIKQRELHPDIKREHFLRDIHHTLSAKFILEEWVLLKIPNENYAKAIALVSEGHRVVDIGNPENYKPKFFVRNGREFVCLPYLSAILRIADELDITNIRTPKLLTKYYMPDNEKSVYEWNKHIVNTLRNVSENYVRFEVECSNYSMLASLEDQFNKIKSVINYCQKVIRNISNTESRKFTLKLEKVEEEYKYIDFDPKGIKYSFDVDNVINAFVGENLYNDKLTSLREAIQNSIDTCRYKKTLNPDYEPKVDIIINDENITISDNGLGMDEFIIKNFFGKLGSSFYQQQSVMKEYEAIGQFGVGVFSYFLIAEYIDIETKTKESETLRFRLDKDPKNYFHFFKDFKRTESGTTITLHLKKEFVEYDTLTFINYIKDKFRYIEFPLTVNIKKDKLDIIAQDIDIINVNELIIESLKYRYKKKFNDINVVKLDINEKRYDVSIVYFYLKKLSFESILHLFHESSIFKNGERYIRSKTEISQKGVFVTNYESLNFSDIYCRINFKQKILDIQISRNEFVGDKKIEEIFEEIIIKLMFKIFDRIKDEINENKLSEISYNFISRQYSFRRIEKFAEVIPKLTTLKVNNGSRKSKYQNFDEFLSSKPSSFYLVLNYSHLQKLSVKDKSIVQLYIKKTDHISFEAYSNYISIMNSHGYYEYIRKIDDYYFTEMIYTEDRKKMIEDREWGDFVFIDSTLDKVEASILTLNKFNLYYISNREFRYNLNHHYINKLYSYLREEPNIEIKTKHLIIEILEYIPNYHRISELSNFLKQLNELAKELSITINLEYNFTRKDFI